LKKMNINCTESKTKCGDNLAGIIRDLSTLTRNNVQYRFDVEIELSGISIKFIRNMHTGSVHAEYVIYYPHRLVEKLRKLAKNNDGMLEHWMCERGIVDRIEALGYFIREEEQGIEGGNWWGVGVFIRLDDLTHIPFGLAKIEADLPWIKNTLDAFFNKMLRGIPK